MAFSYQDYVESERVKALRKKAEEAEKYKESAEVTQARNALAALQKPADYSSKYQPKIDATMAQIENQKPFSYDLNGDMLYQNYKDQFINNGRMVMMNTMGQAAALTGGYGNSYASIAGNQAYQASLQELNAIVPELYQAAYQRYRDDRQDLLDRYGLYTDADARDYAKYRDVVGDYNTDRGYYTDAYNNARNFDYAQYSDMRDYYGNQYNNERSYDYGQYADAYNRAFANYQQGVSESQWAQQMAENKRQFDAQMAYNYSRGSGSGSGSGGDGTQYLSNSDVKDRIISEKDFNANGVKVTRGSRNNSGNGGIRFDGKLYTPSIITLNDGTQIHLDAYETYMREQYSGMLEDNLISDEQFLSLVGDIPSVKLVGQKKAKY